MTVGLGVVVGAAVGVVAGVEEGLVMGGTGPLRMGSFVQTSCMHAGKRTAVKQVTLKGLILSSGSIID